MTIGRSRSASFPWMRLLVWLCLGAAGPWLQAAEPPGGRWLFLGDSITYSGQYIEYFETGLRWAHPKLAVEIINAGLPSETVSGLSEPGHANGEFPRPDLHERLGRALQQARPQVVIAGYGMNDGINYPPAPERFAKYQEGIQRLRAAVEKSGARIIHLTPPVFDPLPIKARVLPAGLDEYRQPFEGYNLVLGGYSDWLLEQRRHGWQVIDLHGPMNRFLAGARQTNATFALAGDGVHPNALGHWLMARELLRHFGMHSLAEAATPEQDWTKSEQRQLLELVRQRHRILRDAWLTNIGHQRPGMSKGLPLAEAEARARELEAKIKELLSRIE